MIIPYIVRESGEEREEEVYGAGWIRGLYGSHYLSIFVRFFILGLICRSPLFSALYGWWQKRAWSKRKIPSFIERYEIDPQEFLVSPEAFSSFNDFFIRKLKPEARPIDPREDVAVIPADGRYFFFSSFGEMVEPFLVKGQPFLLEAFLQDKSLAELYRQGACVIARLNPADCHRFYFPVAGIPSRAELLTGSLYSVNPMALACREGILWENKRYVTQMATEKWGTVLMIEVGATNVGTVIQTYFPEQVVMKGQEKGYFSFGGSAIVLLFPPDKILFDDDLLEATKKRREIRCKIGQSMGVRV